VIEHGQFAAVADRAVFSSAAEAVENWDAENQYRIQSDRFHVVEVRHGITLSADWIRRIVSAIGLVTDSPQSETNQVPSPESGWFHRMAVSPSLSHSAKM
jgi:hypothetical protein